MLAYLRPLLFIRLAIFASALATLLFSNPVLLIADEWADRYRDGLSALNRGDWNEAIDHLKAALSLKLEPEAQAATSSLTMVEYLPYYHLGQAYLYSDQLELALESFENALGSGAATQTTRRRHLEQLRALTIRLIESEASSLPVAKKDEELESSISSIWSLMEQERYDEAQRELDAVARAHPDDNRIEILDKWLRSERTKPSVKPEPMADQNPGEIAFREGLDHFVIGRYEEALSTFRLARDRDPNLSQANDWIQKTEREMQRLNVEAYTSRSDTPPPEIIERTITRTTAPVLAIRDPEAPITVIRSGAVTISGLAGDDQGIHRIEISVNGKTAQSLSGEELVIRPAADSLMTKLTFSVAIPVQMGENEIILAAYDVDSTQHRTLEQFLVTRKPPIYRTSTFAIATGAILLLTAGGLVLTRVIKYRLAIINKYNPYIAGSPIRNEEMLFGREKLLNRILNTLHNNSLMIYGPRRIGKTSLQHHLKHRLHNLNYPEFHFIPVLIDLQGTSEDRFFATMMEEVLDACKSQVNGEVPLRVVDKNGDYGGRDFSRDIKQLLDLLKSKINKKLKLVLLIDEVDELNKYSEQVNQRLRSVFMKTFAENLVAVMSGAYIRKSWESEGSPWYNFFEEIEVPPLDREHTEALIRDPVAGIFSYDADAIEKIIEYSEGKPYIVQKFCVNVINKIIEDKRRRVTLSDVEAVATQVMRSVEE
ncbi:AAA family ATPase [bacterium]|nr:AAA family ATPase [bacterium]